MIVRGARVLRNSRHRCAKFHTEYIHPEYLSPHGSMHARCARHVLGWLHLDPRYQAKPAIVMVFSSCETVQQVRKRQGGVRPRAVLHNLVALGRTLQHRSTPLHPAQDKAQCQKVPRGNRQRLGVKV